MKNPLHLLFANPLNFFPWPRIGGVSAIGLLALVPGMVSMGAEPPAPNPADPVHAIDLTTTPSVIITKWLALGPIPQSAAAKGESAGPLAPLGGESRAILTNETKITLQHDGAATTLAARPVPPNIFGYMEMFRLYPKSSEGQSAYAFTWLTCEHRQSVHAFLKAEDGTKIWVGGEEIIPTPILQPNLTGLPGRLYFVFKLKGGRTPLLLKIPRGEGSWDFFLKLQSKDSAQKMLKKQDWKLKVQRFQETEVAPRSRWFGCNPGPFPEIAWRDPKAVEALYGKVPLHVRWFDSNLNEVQRAEKPGRYVAYVEGRAPDGFTTRRAVTIYCAPEGQEPWRPILALEEPSIELPYQDTLPFKPDIWSEQKECVSHMVHYGMMREAFFQDGQSVALFATMAEQEKPLGHPAAQLDWAATLNQDYQLKLKRRIMGVDDGYYPLFRSPRKKSGAPATVLHEGSPTGAQMEANTAERLHSVCQAWWEDSGEPFSVLVARHGVVVFQGAFGQKDGTSVTLQTLYPLASITKAITGLIFGQFIDQGLISPDDPVGKFLPEFPTTGENVLTLRHCLTHTSGFEGHGLWDGMNNPYLENILASGFEPEKVGRMQAYNGMGFDLAGKVMEVVSGKSIFRLLHENLFQPLGMSPEISQGDLGYGAISTAEDLARIGQLMLNRGSYGDLEFCSPEAFKQLMPFRYREVFPGLKDCPTAYGLGITWARWVHVGLGPEVEPNQKTFLGPNTIGHGAATSCILRADLDHDLVVAMARFGQGKNYTEHGAAFLGAIEESFAE